MHFRKSERIKIVFFLHNLSEVQGALRIARDHSGAIFFSMESIFLNKAHKTKLNGLDN